MQRRGFLAGFAALVASAALPMPAVARGVALDHNAALMALMQERLTAAEAQLTAMFERELWGSSTVGAMGGLHSLLSSAADDDWAPRRVAHSMFVPEGTLH